MLNTALKIKNITIPNRIMMPPMARELSDEGKVSDALIEYYAKRAEGTGLIIVEHEYVSPEGIASPKQLSMADDSVIDGFRKLTDAIHSKGSFAIAQLNHAGIESISHNKLNLNEMTLDEIDHVKESFVKAAVRSKKAGFDGVEIHAAHGYFLSQFYSPYTNKRTDDYGGTLENRIRLHNEIIADVREAVGEDYVIAIRFGAYDYLEGGSKLEDIPIAVESFVKSGADLIDISGGLCRYVNPNSKEPGYFRQLSKIAKDSCDVPVILTGGVKKAKDAENLLNEGFCDLIGIGRALLMDAEWSKKALKYLENVQ
ncbi:NADH:flavin oxidoreductase [Methanobrevibacter sp.]|uniref:NADH:flavin oxidoreductase n=1 Tax=Methanobrevibacter sp. TaxID=66852 RepID=UPI0025D8A2FA|nr:NADH:flavin oxidoreductase [Methanobrevibacter sp.]